MKNLKDILPEKKTKNSVKHFGGNGYYNQQGYNQAIDDCHAKLGEVESLVDNAYKALIHAKNAEAQKMDSYAKAGKLYSNDTRQWITQAMSYLDQLQAEDNST